MWLHNCDHIVGCASKAEKPAGQASAPLLGRLSAAQSALKIGRDPFGRPPAPRDARQCARFWIEDHYSAGGF
jgi:hypothetical protein